MAPLPMTRPYRRDNSGTYCVRKVVPEPLREMVGKRELKASLRTKDPKEARRLAPAVITKFDAIIAAAWEAQRYGPEELQALTGEYYRERLDALLSEARRGNWSASEWEGMEISHDAKRDSAADPIQEDALAKRWGGPRAEALLDSRGEIVTPLFQDTLSLELYKAEHLAIADARGIHQDYREAPARDYPEHVPPEARSLSALFERYADSAGIRPRTRDDWSRKIAHFEEWLQGKPAHRVTPQDVQRYADALRKGSGLSTRELSAKTVNEGYLAAIRGVYAWAVKRGMAKTNPAQGIAVETPSSEHGSRRLAYTREEVSRILLAAREQTTPYKRWTPWLLAFTGARVSEILWRTKADVGQTEGHRYLSIGGQVKNRWSIRCVPLHPALIAEGFLDYWQSLPDGEYLFPGDWSDKHGDRTKTPANRLRDWINGLTPDRNPSIAPNHSFRHWLVSECRREGIDGDLQRELTGHSAKDVHASYGPAGVPILAEALARIPSPVKGSGRKTTDTQRHGHYHLSTTHYQ